MKNVFALFVLYFTIACFTVCLAQYVPKDKRKKNETPVDTTQKNPTSDKPAEEKTPTNTNQDKNTKSSFRERLTFGGNMGVDFPNGLFFLNLSPLVGYKVNDNLTAGLGATWQLLTGNYNYFGQTVKINQQYYGGRVFGTHKIVAPFSAWVEVEGINGEFYNRDTNDYKRSWIVSPLVGAAINQGFGNTGLGLNLVVLYNLNYDDANVYYSSPWVTRIGFLF